MTPTLQSIALMLLLAAMTLGEWSLYVGMPLAVLIVWLPRLRSRAVSDAQPVDSSNAMSELTRDLSYTTSHNALSAAGVAFSVKELAGKLQSQLDAAAQIVNNAEVMIATEQATSQLSREALGAASEAHHSSAAGRTELVDSISRMHQLSQRANASRELIEALSQRSDDIQRVTLVIQSIASQTNLLALNAAIEAARAGDAGRGFAVVADEVRALAHRTQTSTQEIEQMIGNIRQDTEHAVAAMHSSSERVQATLGVAQRSGEALDEITRSISQINERNLMIASATEEQALVAREVDRNLVGIRNLSQQVLQGALHTETAGHDLAGMAGELHQTVARFKV